MGRNLYINLFDEIKIRDSLGLKIFAGGSKKFIAHIISGWFPSLRNDLSPAGVNKERVIDRQNNKYKEKVVDVKSGKIIRDVEENLTDHK
jgi:hypothetical protein